MQTIINMNDVEQARITKEFLLKSWAENWARGERRIAITNIKQLEVKYGSLLKKK